VLPGLLSPLSYDKRLDCHATELGYQIKILPSLGMYDLKARGGFGDAAPEPTGTATISLTEPHAIPAAGASRGRGRTGQSAEMATTAQAWR